MNKCPVCKKNELREAGGNALSRKDNKTEICSACGTREALEELLEWERNNAPEKSEKE